MKKYFILIVIVLLAGSCNDFLDIEPRQETSITEQFSNLAGAKIALAGAYFKTEDVQSDNFFIYPDLLGGNIAFTPIQNGTNAGIIENRGQLVNTYNFNEFSNDSNFSGFYNSCYNVLSNVNNIINLVGAIPDATAEQKNQITAEAYALRAFLHFNLLQIYSQTYNFTAGASHKGIVYADRILKGGVDFPSRLPVSSCYSLIVSDLQKALGLFTANQALPGPVYSYFNATTTKAVLARVALQKNDWQLAASTATEVIATSGVSLLNSGNYISEWEKTNLPVSEVIFELSAPLANGTQLVSSTVAKFYQITFTTSGTPPVSLVNNYASYAASSDLLALFSDEDIRKNCFIQASLRVKIPTGFENRPFSFTKKQQDNAGTIVCRLSEMYLIQAEANARLNNNSAALVALNTLRNRANLSSLVAPTNLLDEIFLERRRELCFESSLLFDIARFNKNVSRGSDCVSNQCNLNFPNNRFVLPIPLSSLNVNQNMIQNEGY